MSLEWDGIEYKKNYLNFSEKPWKLGDRGAIKHDNVNEIKPAKFH